MPVLYFYFIINVNIFARKTFPGIVIFNILHMQYINPGFNIIPYFTAWKRRIAMNKWSKIGISTTMGVCVVSSIHAINKFIFRMSTINHITADSKELVFEWKFGNVSYTVTGKGSPLLLIHDLDSSSSSYEWKKVISLLSRNHCVYAIDLLGCGHSDKPNITYTTYMYTQLINDFIVNVIHKKVSVFATGKSAPIAIMTAYNNSYLFDKIFLVNPESIKDALKTPSKRNSIQRHIINFPVIGTLIYNICMSRKRIHDDFVYHNVSHSDMSVIPAINAYHENSHLGGAYAKYLYSSLQAHYTTASISHALSQLDNCIYILSGENEPEAESITREYIDINPAIEAATIKGTKHLPQYETPIAFVRTANIYLS